jgi:large subunit ribosomal protein L24
MDHRSKSRLRVGDTVVVIAGAHRGQSGRLLRFNGDRTRVFIEGVARVRRHEKPMPALGREGGIVEKEASIHVSNVMLQLTDGTATRVGYRFDEEGKKVRFAKANEEAVSAPSEPGRA